MEPHYFAEDGNFGNADGIAILDTSQWTEDDWMEIESSEDYARADTARQIAQRYLQEGTPWDA